MKKLLIGASLIFLFSALGANAQSRKAVSAAEANGTFRSFFGGDFKGSYSEIKILALGGGKLRVAFELTYPHFDGRGEPTANVGSAGGTAAIKGDTATFKPDADNDCVIRIKFIRRGTIEVAQAGTDAACGFGFNVNASGTYKKSSGAKPKFER